MRELTPEEVLAQLRIGKGGSTEERAAALAVLAEAIADSQNLGRLVVSQGESSWRQPQLRSDVQRTENQGLRRPIH